MADERGRQQDMYFWAVGPPSSENNLLLWGDPGWSLMSLGEALMRDAERGNPHAPLPGPLHRIAAASGGTLAHMPGVCGLGHSHALQAKAYFLD